MNEAEWLAATDPGPMLRHLRGDDRERKWRLFGCACVRRVWHLLADARSRRAVEAVERFADGADDAEELDLAVIGAESVADDQSMAVREVADEAAASAAFAALNLTLPDAETAVDYAAANVGSAVYHAATAAHAPSAAAARDAERAEQARLLREVFGNPFRRVSLAPGLSAWGNGTITQLARAIYDERAFDRLPVLADALEDAGCDSAEVLGHCRQPGEHVRGCWVLDLILGRE